MLLKKLGTKEFYLSYVQVSHQFHYHADVELKMKYNIKLSNFKRERNPDFYPTQDQLLSMSRVAMLSHRLESIIWAEGPTQDIGIYSLSFIFTDGTTSPPPGTYNLDPTLQITLNEDTKIEGMEFGRSIYYTDRKYYELTAIRLFD
jgi:hypothetical protein